MSKAFSIRWLAVAASAAMLLILAAGLRRGDNRGGPARPWW